MKNTFLGIFAVLSFFSGCKVAPNEENTQEASIRAKSAIGWALNAGQTQQVFFHALGGNNICVYGVNANNSEKNSNKESVGRMKQVDLFRGFAEPFPKGSTMALNWSQFSSQVKAKLAALEKSATGLYSAKEEPCRKVAEHRAAAAGGECGFKGLDASVCNTPMSFGAGGQPRPLPGWAICERGTRRESCALGTVNCDPCGSVELCSEGQGMTNRSYEECVYSESRDPDASSCSSADSNFSKAQRAYSFQKNVFELINGEVERVVNGAKVATQNDIRNVNEEMLKEIRKTISQYYESSKSLTRCPEPKSVPL